MTCIPVAVYTVLDSWWWTENLSKTCKVLFHNKFEKLVHLVGFIIRIYHDAWSSEWQNTLKLILHFGGAECSCSCINIVTCGSVMVLHCMRSGYCIWPYNEQNISKLIVKNYGPLGCSGHCLPLACLELRFFFHPSVWPSLPMQVPFVPWRWGQQFLQCVGTHLHGITSQKTVSSLYSPQMSLLLLFV